MKPVLIAGLLALCCTPLLAEIPGCQDRHCDRIRLDSVSDAKSYGLLLEAPVTGCRKVRYVVRSDAAELLGHTPTLRPGELAVVRMGRGFSAGAHALTIEAVGCSLPPVSARRVTLAKASPDHSARAANALIIGP